LWRSIRRFSYDHDFRSGIEGSRALFLQVLKLCETAGLSTPTCPDGTKIKANASKISDEYMGMKKREGSCRRDRPQLATTEGRNSERRTLAKTSAATNCRIGRRQRKRLAKFSNDVALEPTPSCGGGELASGEKTDTASRRPQKRAKRGAPSDNHPKSQRNSPSGKPAS